MINSPKRSIRSYVLRQGRMTDAQKASIERLYPKYGLKLSESKIDLDVVFNRKGADTVLEIGFGMGQSLAEMAKLNPEVNYLGIEVHRPGVGRLMNQLELETIDNVRLLNEDAVTVLKEHLADNCLAGVQIFFPDPWHKKKHHKRRLIQTDFIRLILSKLKIKGFIHVATDWQPYAEHIIEVLDSEPSLKNAQNTNLKQRLLAGRPDTRFENRGKKLGHKISDVVYIREC